MATILALSCGLATAALAGGPAPTIELPAAPDVNAPLTARDARDFDEYFYFHKQGVDYGTALSDIGTCDSYSKGLVPMQRLPAFVPLGGEMGPASDDAATNAFLLWGPVGGAIAGIAIDAVTSNLQHANLRRCMQFHGYARYGTSRPVWSKLRDGGSDALESRLAQIASGQAPQGEALSP